MPHHQYQETSDAILAAQRIVLAGHVNPDGDTLGCVLALCHLLKHLGKDFVAISADGAPDNLRWLPGAEWIQTTTERRDFDLAIVCDAGALERVGRSVMPIIESAPRIIDIDHHVVAGEAFGDIQILDDTAAATAELIYKLLTLFPEIDLPDAVLYCVAQCLMTGLITDTGSFRYLNVTPDTFRTAAALQTWGAVPAVITELVFENRSYASLKLLGRALDALQTTPDGKIAWTRVTARDLEGLGATDADTEGIVNHARAVTTAQIGILFREVPGKKVRISLRARDGADVQRIASVFGGGGHKLASGCSLEPPLADVERIVVAEAARQLSES